MTDIILAENITLTETPEALSFRIQPGDTVVFLTPKDEVTAALTRLLIGLDKPLSGKILLFGSDTATMSQRELLETRGRIGVAFKTGGLVSNLTIWENMTLPLYYHQHLSHKEIESQGIAMLDSLGYTVRRMDLPDHLTVSQKKALGVARAMLIAPEVILYESPVYGLNQEEKECFFKNAVEFHREKPGRISLFITASQEVVRFLPEVAVVNLQRGACHDS